MFITALGWARPFRITKMLDDFSPSIRKPNFESGMGSWRISHIFDPGLNC
jgi:hypothetical protein